MVKIPQGVGGGVPLHKNDLKSNRNNKKKRTHNAINVLSTSSFLVWVLPYIMICKCDAFYHTNLHHSSSFTFSFRHNPRRNSNTYATTTTRTTSPISSSSSSLVLFSSSTRTEAFLRTTSTRNRRNIRCTPTIMAPCAFPCEQTQQEDHYRRCQQLQALRGDSNPENEEQERTSSPPQSLMSFPSKNDFDPDTNSGSSTTGSSSSSKGVATATAPTTTTPDLLFPPSNKTLKVVMGLGFASIAFLSAFFIAFIMTTPSII